MQTYFELNRLLREIAAKALDAVLSSDAGEGFGTVTISSYIQRDIERLDTLWPRSLTRSALREMETALRDDRPHFHALADLALKAGDLLDDHFRALQAAAADRSSALAELLEPEISESSLRQFQQGLFRDAVFNAFVAIFDLLRLRTGLADDGAALAARAFSLEKPMLAVGDLRTTSGQNEQKGFIQLLQGAYLAIRNPKAHTLAHDLDDRKARQYLVLASLLARLIKEAREVADAGSSA